MPTLDSLQLPSFSADALSGSDAARVKSYLYQLTEQLRYVLANLDENNLSAGINAKLSGGGLSSEIAQNLAGISLRVAGQDNALARMNFSLAGVDTAVQAQSGEISRLTQTAQGLSAAVQDAQNNCSQLSQTVEGIGAEVSTAGGELSELRQTAQSLSATVQDNAGSISALNQLKDSLALSVENGADRSTITLTGQGIEAKSQTLRFTGEVVFRSDLTDGKTTVSGDNITTGTLHAELLKTGTVSGSLGYSRWELDTGRITSGSADSTHVQVTPDGIRWYKNGSLTGVVRSVIGSTYYTANSTYCYLGWCDNENNGFGYGGHGLHTLPWSQMWGNDPGLDISVVAEKGLAVHGDLRVLGSIECANHMTCNGSKPRAVPTSFGTEHLFALETPTPAFADYGQGVCGADGLCALVPDPRYAETVGGTLHWFLSAAGPGGALWAESTPWGACAHGAPGQAFGWVCLAPQKNYESWYADTDIEEPRPETEPDAQAVTDRYLDELFNEWEETR